MRVTGFQAQIAFLLGDTIIIGLAALLAPLKIVMILVGVSGVLSMLLSIVRKDLIEQGIDIKMMRNLLIISLVLSTLAYIMSPTESEILAPVLIIDSLGLIRLLFMRAVLYLYKFPF